MESTINRYNATKQETLNINNWLHICRARGLDVGGKQIHLNTLRVDDAS